MCRIHAANTLARPIRIVNDIQVLLHDVKRSDSKVRIHRIKQSKGKLAAKTKLRASVGTGEQQRKLMQRFQLLGLLDTIPFKQSKTSATKQLSNTVLPAKDTTANRRSKSTHQARFHNTHRQWASDYRNHALRAWCADSTNPDVVTGRHKADMVAMHHITNRASVNNDCSKYFAAESKSAHRTQKTSVLFQFMTMFQIQCTRDG